MSVAGSASIGLKTQLRLLLVNLDYGKPVNFTGSGGLDNGMNVSLSFVLDQDDDTTLSEAAREENSFDSHSVTISTDLWEL